MDTLLARIAKKMRLLYGDLDCHISVFQNQTGIGCRTGCGDCCNSPEVEATVAEMLPLALTLSDHGESDFYLEKLSHHSSKRCIFYESSANDSSLGRCGVYPHRPLLCRLFGFAARTGKSGQKELVNCKWQKQLMTSQIEATQALIQQEKVTPPIYSEYDFKSRGIEPSAEYNQRHPINEALRLALEKVQMRFDFGDSESH